MKQNRLRFGVSVDYPLISNTSDLSGNVGKSVLPNTSSIHLGSDLVFRLKAADADRWSPLREFLVWFQILFLLWKEEQN